MTLWLSSCTQTRSETVTKTNTETLPTPRQILISSEFDSIIDARDGEIYVTVKIGKQIWLAENLRYKVAGSMINPDNPSEKYGRLYELVAAQKACPKGWHLPSDLEWDEVEIAHGMPFSFIGKGGWRGEHGTNMKSDKSWEQDGNGTNSLDFNVLPAGYYFSGKTGFEKGLEGLRYSASFWSSVANNVGYARFLFSPRKWINKWEDTNNETGAALSCRCVKD